MCVCVKVILIVVMELRPPEPASSTSARTEHSRELARKDKSANLGAGSLHMATELPQKDNNCKATQSHAKLPQLSWQGQALSQAS